LPLFLHISRLAVDDRAFRLEHSEAEALILSIGIVCVGVAPAGPFAVRLVESGWRCVAVVAV
jgi:hypothetical protein